MVEQIPYLSPFQRRSVSTTQELYETSNRSSNRIATGRRVSQPIDAPVDFFRAKALSDSLSDLGSVKGSISVGRSTLQATNVGLEAVEQFSRQLLGIAEYAKSAETSEQRLALSEQFNEVRQQIDNLVGDTSYLGVNLLNSTGSVKTTSVGTGTESSVVSEGTDQTVNALGIADASATYNDFATLSDITNAIGDVRRAIDQVRSTQSDYTTDLSVLGVRESFTEELSNTLQAGVDDLVNADLNEEAAVQLSANVRSALSIESQRILAQGDSLLLGLVQ
ncbi:MAG: hypothetical protein HWE30_00890 [Methylocystaceae bacterium]|nr:hypothetical protein [Methylocystaceae bacterium]